MKSNLTPFVTDADADGLHPIGDSNVDDLPKKFETKEVYTYDVMSVLNKELQVSAQTVNSAARLAFAIFPERIERVDINHLPTIWVNRIAIQLEDGEYGIMDAKLWHEVMYYLENFAYIKDKKALKYDRTCDFKNWFDSTVRAKPMMEIAILKPEKYSFPEYATQDFVDISMRIHLSLYTLHTFGSGPLETLLANNQPS